jgi:hypothetical protein
LSSPPQGVFQGLCGSYSVHPCSYKQAQQTGCVRRTRRGKSSQKAKRSCKEKYRDEREQGRRRERRQMCFVGKRVESDAKQRLVRKRDSRQGVGLERVWCHGMRRQRRRSIGQPHLLRSEEVVPFQPALIKHPSEKSVRVLKEVHWRVKLCNLTELHDD